jgi:protocatechuate 3,4-dioxygenase beta subunit
MFKMFRLFLLLSLAVFLASCSQPSPAEQPAAPTTAAAPIDPADEAVPETGSATERPSEIKALEGEQPAQVDINCSSPASLTPRATEGPYYSAGSPERTSLVADLPGTRLLLTGYVLDIDCRPVPGAWIDFWQADSQGVYDNAGYTLRGHQYTDENGQYTLETVVPGQYPGRTEHIHVKLQAPGGPVLVTQLYFPAAAQNAADLFFDEKLLIDITEEGADEIRARFDFVVEAR